MYNFNLKDDLNLKKTRVEDAFGEVDNWEIYWKVMDGLSQGRILGLGATVKGKVV